MTYEEAIKKLKEITLWTNFWGGCYNDKLEAIDMAIKSLEKQIPKKVIYHDNCGNPTPNQPRCPRCYEAANETWYYAGESYCEYCGQAMDWKGGKADE